jgi:glycosyltransferase involved in cell wall biosynthesis
MFLPGSHFYGAQALAAGADPRRVCVVHHGIDHGVFASSDRGLARRRLGLDPTAPTVVCAARISPRKGLSYLLDAVAVLRMTIPDIRCIIAGTCNSGSQALLESLLARRRELGLDDSVQIRDDLSHTQMPLLFAAADVVAQPSLAEGLGLAVLEAMACGRAVVGSDIPGIDEVIRPGKTGLLVPPADSASLAATISTLLMDERLRTQLAEAGQQAVADHFSVHRMLSEIESAYQAVVDGAAGRR